MWTSRPANVVGRVTSHLKHLKDQRAEVYQVLTLKGLCVYVGFIHLQCMMRVVIQQDVAPPSLILADVIEIKLHSWKHLLHLLGEAKKKELTAGDKFKSTA